MQVAIAFCLRETFIRLGDDKGAWQSFFQAGNHNFCTLHRQLQTAKAENQRARHCI